MTQSMTMGDALFRREQYSKALQVYKGVIQREPENSAAHQAQARTLAKLGEDQEALEIYDILLLLYPNVASISVQKGNLLYTIADEKDFPTFRETLTLANRAIQLAPQLAEAHMLKGNALWSLKRQQEGLAAMQRAVQLDPLHIDNYLWWIEASSLQLPEAEAVVLEQKSFVHALSLYQEQIQHNPLDPVTFVQQGRFLASKLNRTEEALASFDRALQLDAHLPIAYHAKALLLLRVHRPREAVAVYEQIHQAGLYDEMYQDNRLIYDLHQLKQLQEDLLTYDGYERALQEDPARIEMQLAKGQLLLRSQIHWDQQALAAFEQALKLDPTMAEAYVGRGNVLLRLERYSEAIEVFEHCRHLYQQRPELSTHYANIVSSLKQQYNQASQADK